MNVPKGTVVAVCLGVIVALAGYFGVSSITGAEFERMSDHHKYIYMAEHGLGSFHIAPYCWRVGAPLVVQATGLPVTKGFMVVNSISIVVVCGFLYLSARRLKLSEMSALAAVLVYLASPWTTKMLFMMPWLTEGPFFALFAIAIWASVSRKPVVLIVLTMLGMLVRETALLFPIMYVLCGPLVGQRLRQGYAATGMALVAGCAVMAVLHALIPQQNADAAYLYSLPAKLQLYFDITAPDPWQAALNTPNDRFHMILATLGWRAEHFNVNEVNALAVGTWGIIPCVLVLLAPFRKSKNILWLAAGLVFVYGQLIGGLDTQRILTSGMTIVALLAAFSVEGWVRQKRLITVDVLVFILLIMIVANLAYPAMHLPIGIEFAVILTVYLLTFAIRLVHTTLRSYMEAPVQGGSVSIP